jgi:Cu(I)/Ag(I) efflux system membrane protein CusA/SilA
MQRGSADLNGEGLTVGGIVVMRYGENALAVINRVKARLAELKASLPVGVEIVTVYDRSSLIERSIETLSKTLAEEMLIVSVVIFVFLLHFRSALVVVITLPIAILLAFIPLYYQGFSANIMSLGGIAVAIGAMVDAAIAIVENIHRRLGLWQKQAEDKREPRLNVLIDAMQEVGPSIFVALLIIALSFLPVFALQDSEGRLFKPLAWTKTYSMFFAALLAVTLIPALAVLLIKGNTGSDDNWLNRFLTSAYTPVVRTVLQFRWPVVVLALIAMLSSIIPLQKLGKEFMPPLNEGSILYMPTALPGISIAEAQKTLQTMDSILKQFPEVENVFGKVGRSSSPTDSAPLSMIETNLNLKPKDQWRTGMTWDKLIAEMDEKLQFPGMPNIWWMPIQTRTQMLATGIRSTLGIKVFGDDLAEIEATAIDIENALLEDKRTASLTRSAFAERTTGGYFLDFDIDREAAARFGLNVADVQDVISAAVGGTTVSQTVEGRERYGIRVRYNRDYRNNIDALEQVYITSSTGAQIPISQVAKLKFRTGPPMIRNEDGSLVGFVFVDVNDDIGVPDYVALAKQVVGDSVDLPAGYRLAWAGQFESYERAKDRLSALIPTTVLLIFFMLYFHRKSLFETAVIMLALPFSLIGSSWLLYALGYKLSVAVAVGMIAVAGLAIELGLLMMLYLDIAWRQAQLSSVSTAANYQMLNDAIVEGAAKRLRPKLMTGLALFMGLLPLLYSAGTGADVMKRVAAPMLGGVGTSLLMVLIVFPALYSLWHERSLESAES